MSEKKLLWVFCFWLFFDLSVVAGFLVFNLSAACAALGSLSLWLFAGLYLILLVGSICILSKN